MTPIAKAFAKAFALNTARSQALDRDPPLLKAIASWRKRLAIAFLDHNPELTEPDLNTVVQQTIMRLLEWRICGDRGIQPYADQKFVDGDYDAIVGYLRQQVRRHLFKTVAIESLQWPRSLPQMVSLLCDVQGDREGDTQKAGALTALPIETLGQIYEQGVSQTIRLRGDRQLVIEPRSSVRKAAGVYYTPVKIVDYIIEQTIAKRLAQKTPQQAASLKILDPACGSGSFLLAAYQHLLDWYLEQYTADLAQYRHYLSGDLQNGWRLTLAVRQRILLDHIYGVDIDSQAIETTKLSLLLKLAEGSAEPLNSQALLHDLDQTIHCGNALIDWDILPARSPQEIDRTVLERVNPFSWEQAFPEILQSGGFEVVIGNPPYIDSESMTRFQRLERQYCAARYASASGNWDLFCVFIEKALHLCKIGGLVSLIVPNKLSSSAYAAGARNVLTTQSRLLSLRDYSGVPVFSIAVYPIVFVTQKGISPSATVHYERMQKDAIATQVQSCDRAVYFPPSPQTWSIAGAHSPDDRVSTLLDRLDANCPKLGDLGAVQGAATVAEAYQIQAFIQEEEVAIAPAFQFINSGTIDRYRSLWGEKPCRYLQKVYQRPRVAKSAIATLSKRRIQQSSHAKIIVAGMTKTLECVLDGDGSILAGKSTLIVISALDLRYLLAILNSQLMSFYYRNRFGGETFNGGYLRIGAAKLRQLPIALPDPSPSAQRQSDRLISLVTQILDQPSRLPSLDRDIDHLVYAVYGLTAAEIAIVEASKDRA